MRQDRVAVFEIPLPSFPVCLTSALALIVVDTLGALQKIDLPTLFFFAIFSLFGMGLRWRLLCELKTVLIFKIDAILVKS